MATLVDKITAHAKAIDPGCSEKWKEAYMTGINDAICIINKYENTGAIENRLLAVIESTKPFNTVFAYCDEDNRDSFSHALARAVMVVE